MAILLTKLQNHKGFLRYLRNTYWLLLDKFVRLFTGLVVGVWVARYLGPAEFGLLNYIQSFVFIFMAVGTLGLDSIVVREIVTDAANTNKLLGTAFVLRVVSHLSLFCVLLVTVALVFSERREEVFIFIFAAGTLFHVFHVIDYYYYANVLGKYCSLSRIIAISISALARIFLIMTNSSLLGFIIVFVVESALVSLFLIIFYWFNGQSFRNWKIDFRTATRLLKSSWPLLLSSIAITIYMRIDQVMLNHLLDDSAVGQYSASVRISQVWYFVPTVISASLFPAIVNAKKNSSYLHTSRMQNLYDFLALLSIVIALPTCLLSEWIVDLLFGIQYGPAGEVLMIHIWAGVFVSLGVAGSKWLVSENLQIYSTINTFIGAFVNIGLNMILIPTLGIKGAAWATLISYCLSAYICLSFFRRTRKSFLMMTKSLFVFRRVAWFLR